MRYQGGSTGVGQGEPQSTFVKRKGLGFKTGQQKHKKGREQLLVAFKTVRDKEKEKDQLFKGATGQ